MVGGDMTVGATRAPTTGARVICRGGYESGECPFGRNIILNDDIGGARGGARNRARSGPSTYALHARKWKSRAVCGVWRTARVCRAKPCPRFCGFPSLRDRPDLFRSWGVRIVKKGEWNLSSFEIWKWFCFKISLLLRFSLFRLNRVIWMKWRIVYVSCFLISINLCFVFQYNFFKILRNCCLGIACITIFNFRLN